MIYKKQYGQPFDTESVVGSFLPMMETIPYLTKEPDGFSYAMELRDMITEILIIFAGGDPGKVFKT
jgi:alpha-glucosidase